MAKAPVDWVFKRKRSVVTCPKARCRWKCKVNSPHAAAMVLEDHMEHKHGADNA